MAAICPSCDRAPPPGAQAGTVCPACGARLIAHTTRDPLIGQVVDGRFEVLAKIGQGGMGTVYRARQVSIDREIALKVLDHRMGGDTAAIKRFFREAKTASSLAHPHSVQIIEFGQNADGALYIAMELVRGRNLLEEANRVGPLGLDRVATIGTQLCDVLEAAHALSIVHRDLKLENIMLVDGPRDFAKVLDFGLALSLVDPNGRATATGLISGTPRYMPPEVGIEAAPPAAPQDMYALGVILAELSIGKPLWTAPTIEALFMKKMEEDASVSAVPAPLRSVVRALLSPDPAKRPTAGMLRNQLLSAPFGSTVADVRPGVAQPPEPSMPAVEIDLAIDASKLVDLDARDGAPPPQPLPVAPRTPPSVRHPPSQNPFEPPASALAAPVLEVDAGWAKERAQKQDAAKQPPPKPPLKLGRYLAMAVIVALLGVTGVVVYQRMTKKTPDPHVEGGVTITIKSVGNRAVSVDGKSAGVAPFELKLPKGKKPLRIDATNAPTLTVIPDHDQTIDLDNLVQP